MSRRLSLLAAACLVLSGSIEAQVRRDEQFYYPGAFNWTFLRNFPEAARLFNAFDYGHSVLYEILYAKPTAPTALLEQEEFDYLTRDLLIRPPRFAIVEEAVAPTYAKLAWRAKQMFDRAHILHRQIYDVYADDRLSDSAKFALVERLTDWYLLDRAYAFVAVPKDMALMDEQYYSKTFRVRYPNFNGLIWAYHWLQVGLYEPLITGRVPAERKAGVKAALARFWSMLGEPPSRFPTVMPMTSAIAPTFARRHPRAAVIFDNLHMMHDIISDILVSERVPRGRKRAVIDSALAEFRNPDRNVIELEHWYMMADHMGGVDLMGGSAANLIQLIKAPAHPGDRPRPDQP
jgi:hypothetical protein